MLEFKNISLKAGKKPLLNNINFKAEKGGITVLLGKNGSGKTTLLSSVFGLCRYNGQILLEGQDIKSLKSSERAKRVAFFPQLLPGTGLDVLSLVSLGRNPYLGAIGSLSEDDKRAIQEALVATGTDKLSHRSFSTLSGGERQKVFLAMILAQNTPLILLDEPSSFLDPSSIRDLFSILKEQTEKNGKTVLAVTHDISFAARIADRIAIIENGTLAACESKKDILESEIIEKVFSVTKYISDENVFFF